MAALHAAGRRAIEDLVGSCPDLRHVLHLDLINRNVLVSDDRLALAAVFDWGCLAYGAFLYEIGCLTFFAPWHPGLAATDLRRAVSISATCRREV
jgi:Ser/Thr protein kinase RdoA (MazF antagonist)